MIKRIKIIFLHISKWIGFFRISRHITRNRLRILCYHGFGIGDETRWLPGMFTRPDTFRKRLSFLEKKKFPVLRLEHALNLLSQNKLPFSSTVITIDDGFFSTKLFAHPLLAEKSYPYTIYVTSYYSMKETPIFNLVVQYMFWKTKKEHLNLQELGGPFSGVVSFSDKKSLKQIMNQIIEYGHFKLNNHERDQLMVCLGKCLDINYEQIKETRILSLLTASEITELVKASVDIQLHTHRHKWPSEKQAAVQELIDNKYYLETLVGKPLHYFCYPSGRWDPKQFPFLEAIGIKSATTCDFGMNHTGTPKFELKRFLDGEHLSQIEFEAIICGYWGLLIRLRELVTGRKSVP